jgi:hypothetical protein
MRFLLNLCSAKPLGAKRAPRLPGVSRWAGISLSLVRRAKSPLPSPGIRESFKNAVRATGDSLVDAWNGTWDRVRGRWREELLLAFALGLVFMFFGPDPGEGDPPKIVQAFALPLGALFVAGVLLYLWTLLRTPVEDHRKLVYERDEMIRQRDVAQAEHERFRRDLYLRYRAHNWRLWAANQTRVLSDVINRGDSYDLAHDIRDTRRWLEQVRDELLRLGQPALASAVTFPEGQDSPASPEEMRSQLERLNGLFIGWAAGAKQFPAYDRDASDEGLTMPPLFMP